MMTRRTILKSLAALLALPLTTIALAKKPKPLDEAKKIESVKPRGSVWFGIAADPIVEGDFVKRDGLTGMVFRHAPIEWSWQYVMMWVATNNANPGDVVYAEFRDVTYFKGFPIQFVKRLGDGFP